VRRSEKSGGGNAWNNTMRSIGCEQQGLSPPQAPADSSSEEEEESDGGRVASERWNPPPPSPRVAEEAVELVPVAAA
jgi:hypothetical protein